MSACAKCWHQPKSEGVEQDRELETLVATTFEDLYSKNPNTVNLFITLNAPPVYSVPTTYIGITWHLNKLRMYVSKTMIPDVH